MEKWMEELTIEDLPELYQPLAHVLGVEGTINMAKEFGGSYIYIPKIDKLLRIMRDASIQKEHFEQKVSVRRLAQKYKLTDSRIREILADCHHPDQITIFDVGSTK